MKFEYVFQCRKCLGIASPECGCGNLFVKKLHITRKSFLVEVEDIDTVSMLEAWKDGEEIVKLTPGPLISAGRIENITYVDVESVIDTEIYDESGTLLPRETITWKKVQEILGSSSEKKT